MKHLSFNRDLEKPETVIVLGVGRGGTSLVSGTLRCLDVSMGSSPHPLRHEWSPVVYASEGQVDIHASLQNIEAMNSAHEVWGWKYPADLFALDTILPLVRSPGLVIVTRDLVDLTLSSERYGETPWEIGFYENAAVYRYIGTQLRFWPYPILAFSFHEIVGKPEEFVELLCSFLQISPTAEQKRTAVAFNQPEQNSYRSVDPAVRMQVSAGDLQKDIDALGAVHIGRYCDEYISRFEGMRNNTAAALDMFAQHFTAAGRADERLDAIAARMRQTYAHFMDDLSHGSDAAPPSLPADGTASVALFRHILAASESAFESISRSLLGGGYTTTQAYMLLRKLRRVFLLLISLRTALQKCLQLFAPPSA
ncbi:hypothetical protein BH18VER1_BH18VER1_04260 [soil metagenome]